MPLATSGICVSIRSRRTSSSDLMSCSRGFQGLPPSDPAAAAPAAAAEASRSLRASK